MAADEAPPAVRRGMGIVFVAAGTGILLIGLGVIVPQPGTIHAPLWLIGLLGIAFALAGAMLLIGATASKIDPDGGLPREAPFALRALQTLCGLVVVGTLATAGTWIAFGDGARHFNLSVSVFDMSSSSSANEALGRIAFGAFAVTAWLFLLALTVQGYRKLFGPR